MTVAEYFNMYGYDEYYRILTGEPHDTTGSGRVGVYQKGTMYFMLFLDGTNSAPMGPAIENFYVGTACSTHGE
jgi:hypothetical protein